MDYAFYILVFNCRTSGGFMMSGYSQYIINRSSHTLACKIHRHVSNYGQQFNAHAHGRHISIHNQKYKEVRDVLLPMRDTKQR